MATSRLEKIGTIYSRTRGLIQAGALKWQDRPVWYDLYEAFPPKEEPRYDRPAPPLPVKQIFYNEDKIRAKFQKRNKNIGTVYLLNNRGKSITQRFIDTYQKLETHYKGSVPDDQVYSEALEMFKKSYDLPREETASLSSAFKDAQNEKKTKEVGVNVKDIFKN